MNCGICGQPSDTAAHPECLKARKSNKFGAHRTELDGLTFDSKGEAGRWAELQLLERAGEIQKLRRQVKFNLAVKNVPVCAYVADFVYFEAGREVVEDFKSKATRTPEYRIKAKLMLAVWGIHIREVME